MIKSLDQITAADLKIVGGKSLALARMHQNGFLVPNAVCVTTNAYDTFIADSGLRARIQMEVSRKDFAQMRWEEIWDAALRIRNLFLKTMMPPELNRKMRQVLEPLFADSVVAVRSSAPEEDARGSSFAGLHESFVNIKGLDRIIDHVRLVWASLWSDAAMLYRKEIGLDVHRSKMAVLVQEMIDGDRSGVIFTRNPSNSSESVIESVHGLNQGLVDGIIEPDRWTLDRRTGKILSHVPAERKKWMVAGAQGVQVANLPPAKAGNPPLKNDDVFVVLENALAAEQLFEYPQDMEWTFKDNRLHVLQSRPISTGTDGPKSDDRGWYLSLRRSLENLKSLRERIEQDLVPAMISEGDALAGMDIENLTDQDLAVEIERRARIYRQWEKIYWADFIPFAHGMRMFGQVYNDAVRPEDPFEFVRLLETSDLKSIERNQKLAELAGYVRQDQVLKTQLETGQISGMNPEFTQKAWQFFHHYMDAAHFQAERTEALPELLVSLIVNMAAAGPKSKKHSAASREQLESDFLSRFDTAERDYAVDLLDLARASYRLRDDDNMFLGRLEREMYRAGNIGKQKIGINIDHPVSTGMLDEIAKTLRDHRYEPDLSQTVGEAPKDFDLLARQLIGQPAGQGVGTGIARVIQSRKDLGGFCNGEVLVCDAIDPNMTLIVPMAAAIVERRGGMLIHGAIIAREYGIPCVTGVPDATRAIRNGDELTVDGYLGIVTVRRENEKIP